MWFLFALITFLAWGTADLFYKKGAVEHERYSHLKTSIMVGLVMGAVAIGMIIFGGIEIALLHVWFGIICCLTIVGIPFGLQHFKMALLALVPFGKQIS